MANRGLSDHEISLVKAMINQGMPAQDICGYLFRPGRSLNPAGVYEIKGGRRGAEVPAATAAELAAWLQSHPFFGASDEADNLAKLRKELRGILRFRRGVAGIVCDPSETNRIEFKEAFQPQSFNDYCRSLIAYANHAGGFIIFGINNNKNVIGLQGPKFRTFDQKNVSELIKDLVSPTVRWSSFNMSVAGLDLGVFYAEEADVKPLVTLKNHGSVKANSIYFRYEGETALIRAGDLHSIIQKREQEAVQAAISKLHQISGIGLDNAAVVDITSGEVFPPEGRAQQREEEDKAVAQIVIRKEEITDRDVLLDFIEDAKPVDPLAYLRQSAHESVRWLPLFYYVRLSSLAPTEVAALLGSSNTSKPGALKHICQRLNHQITAYRSYVGRSPLSMLKQLKTGKLPAADDLSAARHFAASLATLESPVSLPEAELRAALRYMLELYTRFDRDSAIASNMRRSAARVDELLYGPPAMQFQQTRAPDRG